MLHVVLCSCSLFLHECVCTDEKFIGDVYFLRCVSRESRIGACDLRATAGSTSKYRSRHNLRVKKI